MARSEELAVFFAKPTAAVHRRFEVCRAYFMEGHAAGTIARRFGLHIGSVQVMVRDFAAHPQLEQFFVCNRPGRKTSPKREGVARRVAALRREGKTLGEIHQRLRQDGYEISESYLARILREAGFARAGKRRLAAAGRRGLSGCVPCPPDSGGIARWIRPRGDGETSSTWRKRSPSRSMKKSYDKSSSMGSDMNLPPSS